MLRFVIALGVLASVSACVQTNSDAPAAWSNMYTMDMRGADPAFSVSSSTGMKSLIRPGIY